MRILNVIPSLSGGGAERQLRYLAGELVARGHQAAVAYSSPGPSPSVWDGTGVELIPLSGGPYDPRLALRLGRIVRRWRPDVVQSWILLSDIVASAACALAGVPLVVREPTSGVWYERNWKGWIRAAAVKRAASVVVANSAGGFEYWASVAPRLRRIVIPNALPLDEIGAAAATTREHASPLALYAGRLEASKNVDVLIRAVAAIEGLRLQICGDGPQREALGRLAASLGIADRTQFAGQVGDVWSRMKTADVFVSPSAFEGRPNAVIEAMACGTPLVVSDIPAHREILDDGSARFVPIAEEALRSALAEVLADLPAARERAERAKAATLAWSLPSIATDWEALYREVALSS